MEKLGVSVLAAGLQALIAYRNAGINSKRDGSVAEEAKFIDNVHKALHKALIKKD